MIDPLVGLDRIEESAIDHRLALAQRPALVAARPGQGRFPVPRPARDVSTPASRLGARRPADTRGTPSGRAAGDRCRSHPSRGGRADRPFPARFRGGSPRGRACSAVRIWLRPHSAEETPRAAGRAVAGRLPRARERFARRRRLLAPAAAPAASRADRARAARRCAPSTRSAARRVGEPSSGAVRRRSRAGRSRESPRSGCAGRLRRSVAARRPDRAPRARGSRARRTAVPP